MHRPGANPMDMQLSDFLCDFCLRPWNGQFPMVEGHEGSLICDRCLESAYRALVHEKNFGPIISYNCTLCLENRDQPGWSPSDSLSKYACMRCINQAAVRLERESDWDWIRPRPTM